MMQETGLGQRISQRTLRHSIGCVGVGLHSGARVALTLHPAEVDQGIRFRRADRPGASPIRAEVGNIADDGPDATTLSAPGGPRISSIEHLMAAFAACGVTNALVDVGGPELPAMDGSAQPFVFLIECAGIVDQPAMFPVMEVQRRISVTADGGWLAIEPADALIIDCRIDTGCARLDPQSRVHRFEPELFRSEIAPARTYAAGSDLAQLQSAGRLRGATFKNLILLDEARVVNPEGLRFADEPVRHWILDCVGDLRLTGSLVRGRLTARRATRSLTARLLAALRADPAAWRSSAELPAMAAEESAPAARHA